MAFTTVTVTGNFREADGDPAEGQVEFSLNQELYNSGADEIAVRTPVAVPLINGNFSVDLYATTDADTSPTGGTYRCVVRTGTLNFEFNFELDASDGPVNIADLKRVTPSYALVGFNVVRYAGSYDDPVTSPDHIRPNTEAPVYWICATGVTPVNTIDGDIIYNKVA